MLVTWCAKEDGHANDGEMVFPPLQIGTNHSSVSSVRYQISVEMSLLPSNHIEARPNPSLLHLLLILSALSIRNPSHSFPPPSTPIPAFHPLGHCYLTQLDL